MHMGKADTPEPEAISSIVAGGSNCPLVQSASLAVCWKRPQSGSCSQQYPVHLCLEDLCVTRNVGPMST